MSTLTALMSHDFVLRFGYEIFSYSDYFGIVGLFIHLKTILTAMNDKDVTSNIVLFFPF